MSHLYNELWLFLGLVRLCPLAYNMGVLLTNIRNNCLPEKWHAICMMKDWILLLWYSRSAHPEKWHALYNVNACENYYLGKWQAMHDANSCENCDDSRLVFKCMWRHQCIATQMPCYCRFVHKNVIGKLHATCRERGSTSSALTHWGRDNMAAISQTTLSNAFFWMKML